MNRQALEYWLDGHDMEYESLDWGYALGTSRLKNDFVREIGACKAELRISTTGNFLIVDPEKVVE